MGHHIYRDLPLTDLIAGLDARAKLGPLRHGGCIKRYAVLPQLQATEHNDIAVGVFVIDRSAPINIKLFAPILRDRHYFTKLRPDFRTGFC